ncbi:protein tumorous imaginal discs, mitochondrial-like isoform X1 [Mytilus trossulus]|uniref:protein tumorous imaginal discs, mitochondrial-like isoform X1 n=1 Tax=Mytilus trossulus TaxID=6551 RepID=UPI0030074A27
MAALRGACCRLGNKKLNATVVVSGRSSFPDDTCHHIERRCSSSLILKSTSKTNLLSAAHKTCCLHRKIHRSSPNNKKDYYELLGVPKNADAKAIKKAYYELAKKHHPDVSKNDAGSAKKFQDVSEAYEVLSDSTKRREYDTFGMGGGMGGMGGASRGQSRGQAQGFENFHGSIDPEELFRNIFGQAGFKMGGAGGFNDFTDYESSKWGFAPATEATLDLSFQEAARGVNKDINVNVKDTCPKCNGNKCEPGTSAVRCHQCNGTGMEDLQTGPFVMRSTCRVCYGAKKIIKQPCTECQGKGNIIMRKKVVVPVPAGVEDGQTVRMMVGKEEIFITFKVAKSRDFKRQGADLHSEIHISVAQAVLGGTIRIPGVYEEILLNIPAGSQSHDRIRLAGKGLKRVNSYGHGDHYVHLHIKVPVSLSKEQEALMLAYAETEKVKGTVNGIVNTAQGQTAVDENGLVALIREALAEVADKKLEEGDKETVDEEKKTGSGKS